MNWRNKARLAAAVAKLPTGLSFNLYYFIQRHYGTLRRVDPTRQLRAGSKIVSVLERHQGNLDGSATFLEVGTGRALALPFALWLCGALRIITVDVNRYLKEELVFEQIRYLREHQDSLPELFGRRSQSATFRERLDFLVNSRLDFASLLSRLNILYLAPTDTGQLAFASQSIDCHVSYGVLQHIPPTALISIFREGKRLLKPTGLLAHYAVLGDLFSGVDRNISHVNFLQYSDEEWESIAGNRYMYHNRLRVDELCELLTSQGLRLLCEDVYINAESLELLQSQKLVLDERFKKKSPEINATESMWIIGTPE